MSIGTELIRPTKETRKHQTTIHNEANALKQQRQKTKMIVQASRSLAVRSATMANRQQRRGMMDYLVNYPDKVSLFLKEIAADKSQNSYHFRRIFTQHADTGDDDAQCILEVLFYHDHKFCFSIFLSYFDMLQVMETKKIQMKVRIQNLPNEISIFQ